LHEGGSMWHIVTLAEDFWRKLPKESGRNSLQANDHPFNRAKYFKLQWNKLDILSCFKYVIWLDATIQLTSPFVASSVRFLVNQCMNAITFEHMRSGSVKVEAELSVKERYSSSNWQNHEQPVQNVKSQYENYTVRYHGSQRIKY